MQGVECAKVDRERGLRSFDDESIDRNEIQHGEELAEFLPFPCRLPIIEVADQTLPVDRAIRFDFDETR